MASPARGSVTAAVRVLRAAGVAFTEHAYPYQERGGTAWAAQVLGLDHHAVIKTLVMADAARRPLVVLMHGDREVSTRALSRHLGTKSVAPCSPDEAQRHSGYQVGGTSPFGLRKPLPVYMEASIAALPRIWINGGARGYLVGLAPADLVAVLAPTPVEVAQPLAPGDEGPAAR